MKNLLILSGIIMLAVISCKKLDELTQFKLQYESSVTIPSTAAVNLPLELFTPEIESDAESKFAVNDTRKDMVEEIYLDKLELTLTAPEDGDFSFLKSIEIFISADDLPEVSVATIEEVPEDVEDYLELETSKQNLQEYIKKDQFQLKVRTVTDELISSDHDIDINSVFQVDAKVLGI